MYADDKFEPITVKCLATIRASSPGKQKSKTFAVIHSVASPTLQDLASVAATVCTSNDQTATYTLTRRRFPTHRPAKRNPWCEVRPSNAQIGYPRGDRPENDMPRPRRYPRNAASTVMVFFLLFLIRSSLDVKPSSFRQERGRSHEQPRCCADRGYFLRHVYQAQWHPRRSRRFSSDLVAPVRG